MACGNPGVWVRVTALICAALLARGDLARGDGEFTPQPASPQQAAAPEAPNLLSADQLDSLVAPIALYPDPLLAQVLAASTYPLELVQLQQWLTKHEELKDKALADAAQREDWDPSIQALAALPDVVKQLTDNIKWTGELGNAFLAQQSDVMDAVQRMRTKANDAGKLKSTEQMRVETKVVESKSVVVIQQANPQVVYVPSYNPVVVWGPPIYAYPPIYYPPPRYYAAGVAISFGVGVAMGAFWSGGWGYNCRWGSNNTININNNNNFVRNNNVNRNNLNGGNRTNLGSGNSNWQHNPRHRGGAPYGDRATANKYGGAARGDSLSMRQASARQNQGQLAGRQQPGVGNRTAGGAGNVAANRGTGNERNLAANRGVGGAGSTSANRGGAGADRIGNRQVSGADGSRGAGAFSGAGRTSGDQARASSARGASSFSGSRGEAARGGGPRR